VPTNYWQIYCPIVMNKENKEAKQSSSSAVGSHWTYVMVIGLNIIYILLFYWINQSYGNL
jgi:hypothetical protein